MLELALTGTGHCVDSLIIWLLVDYKREGRTHSHTHWHRHTHAHSCTGLQWSTFPHSRRQQTKAQGRRNWWGQRNCDKACCERQLLSAASFLMCLRSLSLFPTLILSLSLSWLPRISLSCLRFKMKTHKNRTHRAGPVFNFTHARVCQSNHKENYIAKLSGNEAWHSPSSSSSFFPFPVRSWPNFKLDIVSQGRRGKVNHSKNFDFI